MWTFSLHELQHDTIFCVRESIVAALAKFPECIAFANELTSALLLSLHGRHLCIMEKQILALKVHCLC